MAVLVLVLSVISTIAEIQLLHDLKAAEESFVDAVPQTRIDSNDIRQLVIGLAWLLVFVLGVITFLMWLHCAATNQMKAGWTRFSPAWCLGWWFVPIANLFKPYQVLKDIWVQSSSLDPAVPDESATVWSWLGWYWAAFLIGGWLGQIVFRMTLGAETYDDFLIADYVSIASDAMWVVAGVLLYAYVGEITRRQSANRSVL